MNYAVSLFIEFPAIIIDRGRTDLINEQSSTGFDSSLLRDSCLQLILTGGF